MVSMTPSKTPEAKHPLASIPSETACLPNSLKETQKPKLSAEEKEKTIRMLEKDLERYSWLSAGYLLKANQVKAELDKLRA